MQTDDTPTVQRMLDAGKGGTVRIPAGEYRIATALYIDSGTTLIAEPGARFTLGDNAGVDGDAFLLTNRNYVNNGTPGPGDRDITVIGGVWDGNAAHNPRGQKGDPKGYSGVPLSFYNVERLTLRGLTLRNPETFNIRICRVRDFLIEDLVFDCDFVRRNQDGVHINGFCERGIIRRLRGVTPDTPNDDMVAFNADDGFGHPAVNGFEPGPIRDIHVEDLECISTWNFVRMLSRTQPIERVSVRNVRGGCKYHALNLDLWAFPPGNGHLRDILVADWEVGKTDAGKLHPLIPIQAGCENVRIERFRRADRVACAAPTLLLNNHRDNRLQLSAPGRPEVDVVTREFALPDGGIERLQIDAGPGRPEGGPDTCVEA